MAAKDPMLARLGQVLRSAREKTGLSQEEFAFKCGVHRTYIGAVERGEYNVTLLTLRRITASLDMSMTQAVAAAERADGRRAGLVTRK